jgi:hypothetical protein
VEVTELAEAKDRLVPGETPSRELDLLDHERISASKSRHRRKPAHKKCELDLDYTEGRRALTKLSLERALFAVFPIQSPAGREPRRQHPQRF